MSIETAPLRVALSLAILIIGKGAVGQDFGRRDTYSFSNADQVRVRRVRLDLTVDFNRKELRGVAILEVERRPSCPEGAPLILDTDGLKIEGVWAGTAGAGREVTPFVLGAAHPLLGAPLTITLPERANQVTVAYRTTPSATALQWLDPPHTAGKNHPFLFTQSQAIHARTWIPIQDSPGVRLTFEAAVEVPRGLTAVMGAEHRAVQGNVFRFEMNSPIPPYLIALAVGDLAFQPLGPRTGVYAEPAVTKAAAREFSETEAMIDTVEKRFGPYRWGRYDLLVLPPSFPFGGMENPTLTFTTPTLLAGDRSLVSLIGHELSHSWAGNLVTNATWNDFWLNEGVTTYLERRILEDLYSPERAAMEAVLGLKELRAELKDLAPRDQILRVDLAGRNPDDAGTSVPYEKGALFLTTLERAFGRTRFDAFLRSYFDHFAFQSITTADFEDYLREKLLDKDPGAAASVDTRAWLYEPGLPAGFPEPKSERFAAVERVARDWLEGRISTQQIDAKAWSTHEWLHFLQAFPEKLPVVRMAQLDHLFQLTNRGNSEIAEEWLLMSVRNGYMPADARLESFLTTIGRRKFLLPLYTALNATPEGRRRAAAIYAKARPFYHPITVDSIDRLLKEPREAGAHGEPWQLH